MHTYPLREEWFSLEAPPDDVAPPYGPAAPGPGPGTAPEGADEGLDAAVRAALARPLLLVKAGPVKDRPGLALRDLTDRAGHHTKRWMRTAEDAAEGKRGRGAKPGGAPGRPAAGKGDVVKFRGKDGTGKGQVVAAGKDGVTVRDAKGREHRVLHRDVVARAEGPQPHQTARLKHAQELAERVDRKGGERPAYLADLLAQAHAHDERVNELLDGHGGDPVGLELEHKEGGRYARILPDASQPGKHRIQRYDEHGFSGHDMFDTPHQALEDAVTHGYHQATDGRVLGRLAGTEKWKRGMRYADLTQQLGSGQISQDRWHEEVRKLHEEAQRAKSPGDVQPLFDERERALPEDASQPVADPDGLYRQAEEALRHYRDWLDEGNGIADRLGYRTYSPTSLEEFNAAIEDLDRPGGVLLLAPLKSQKRAKEKVEADYQGDWSKLTDVVRATLAVDTYKELKPLLARLKQAGLQLARRPKDRFVKPVDVGYRDVLMNVRLPNGHIGELQLHVKTMLKAKEVAHKLYEETRSIAARLATEGRDESRMTREERAVYDAANARAREIYAQAWSQAIAKAFGARFLRLLGGMGESKGAKRAAAAAGSKAVRYFDLDGALVRRQSADHWPEIHVGVGRWLPYHDLFRFDHEGAEMSEGEALRRMTPPGRYVT
jgi:hypothetical protein